MTDAEFGLTDQYKKTWDKLFSLLKGPRQHNSQYYHKLMELPSDERESYVESIWGGTALEKIRPMLQNIVQIEEQLNKLK